MDKPNARGGEMMTLPKPKPDQIIAELRRELLMRASVYPGLIRGRSLRPYEAAWRNACVRAAIAALEEHFASSR